MFHLTLMWLAIVAAAYAVGHAYGWKRHARTLRLAAAKTPMYTEKS